MKGTNSVIDAANGVMTSKPVQNSISEYVLNLNFSYSGNAEKYGIEIRLPASIFKDRNGNNIGEVILPLEKYPNIPTSGANFNYEIDQTTNEIIIRNTQKVEGNFYLITDIKYTVLPSEVKMDQVTVAGETVYRQKNDFTATMTCPPILVPVRELVEI